MAFADRLLLNKCDLVTEEELTRVEARLKEINKFAPILRTTKAEVSADSVLWKLIRGLNQMISVLAAL